MTAISAITLWQPWASLVIEGAKSHEFRKWPAPKHLRGQRIAIHAGARKIPAAELRGLIYKLERGHSGSIGSKDRVPRALDVVERFWRDPSSIIYSAVLGTAILGEPVRCVDLFGRSTDEGEIDEKMWAWPVSDIQRYPVSVPAKGAQGFWTWSVPSELAA